MSVKRKVITEIVAFVLFAAAVIGFIRVSAAVIRPKNADYGTDWSSFLAEDKNSVDVLFFGSSMVYCDVVPSVIWRQSGITSYVVGGGEQTLPMSYYYIRQALKTQKPQAVFLELSGMFFDRYTNYEEANIGYMPWSLERTKAALEAASPARRVFLAACPPSLLTIIKQHYRLPNLTADDFRYAFRPDVHQAGYTFLSKAASDVTEIRTRPTPLVEKNYAVALEYLRKIEDFCRQEDVALYCFISPSAYRYSETLMSRLRADAEFINFNDDFDSLGLDLSRDFFDSLHFNCFGAEKFSAFLAQKLPELGIVPSDPDRLDGVWTERSAQFVSKVDSVSQ